MNTSASSLSPRARWLRDRRFGGALLGTAALGVALAFGWPALRAQIEGDRGIAPVASTGDYEIGGIQVETTADNAAAARLAGWAQARRKAWEKLWAQRGGGGTAPALSDEQLNAMTSAISVQNEQLGPRRYIATLGVVFDRTRSAPLLGIASAAARSAPLLVIPVLFQGGTAQVFETRNPWQNAWAQFRAGESQIDYVRPNGAGSESLLVTAGQPGRRSRVLWRDVLDYFGASDVLIPMARLERQYPGGPVRAYFTARHGPDNRFLASFTLTAPDEDGIPAMFAQAVTQFDRIFTQALIAGQLSPDPTLRVHQTIDQAYIDGLINEMGGPAPKPAAAAEPAPGAAAPATAQTVAVTIQFATPDPASVDAVLGAVRATPGVQSASVTSVAIGGTSVMRVTYAGEVSSLSSALAGHGFRVSPTAGGLTISR